MSLPPLKRKPRICIIGYKSLSQLAHVVIPEYEDRASFTVIDVLFSKALETAHQLERDGAVDVIISAGGNAAYIRNSIKLPVVAIKITGFDILRALLKARAISDNIGVVTYLNPIPELDDVKEIFRLNIVQKTYCTLDDAAISVKTLAREGYQVAIGSSVVMDQAERNGVHGVLIYSLDAVRQALDDALEIARFAQLEAARYDQLNNMLFNLREAVLAIDMHGRITAINPAMERLLSSTRQRAIGSAIGIIAPDLASVTNPAADSTMEPDQVVQIGQVTCIANWTPLSEDGVRTGGILTLQEASAIHRADTSIRTQRRSRQLTARYRFSDLTGNAQLFTVVKQAAARYARTDSTILITGESGTGKELFAQSIHNASARRNYPFVAINCAAFPETLLESEIFGYEEGAFTGSRKGGKPGLFEAAHTGTIFLDEIGDMPLSLQSRLLRVLQEKEVTRLGSTQPVSVNVRIIAATHQSLTDRIAQGLFRADLFYRLNILHLDVPPLRERPADIAPLALRLLHVYANRFESSISVEAVLEAMLPVFQAYHWPGNVRELENICERLAVIFGDYPHHPEIEVTSLKPDFPELFAEQDPPSPMAEPADPGERAQPFDTPDMPDQERIRQVLAEVNNNRNLAARKLGISRTTLWRRMREAETDRADAQGWVR